MSKKGQALIEFILIMPVMVYLILVFVDFSLILSTKNKLDNNVSNLVMANKEYDLFVRQNRDSIKIGEKIVNKYGSKVL